MKYAFFSDVHGNLEALNAVRKDMEQQGIDKIFFLGDAVGYGPNPNEAVALINEMASVKLAGNHDYAALGKTDLSWFSDNAREAITWTIKQLKEETRNALGLYELKHTILEDDILLVHSTPREPETWDYILSAEQAQESFRTFREQICLISHTHVPVVYEFMKNNGVQTALFKDALQLQKDCRYIINIGSVGQPRDGDTRACYVIFNTRSRRFKYRRVKYSIGAVQDKMKAAGLPYFLITRLALGH